MVGRLAAVAAALLALPSLASGASSFVPNDPLVPRQWYLTAIRAFDAWPERPTLGPVLVAVIDSGIDAGHPEFAGRVAAARSFVGGDVTDKDGHGTFVAGLIAAATNNAEGIAGVAFPAQLLVAKVTRGDGTISLEAEARAIRWAADNGARVINLSLGGLRDPRDRRGNRDAYSELEQRAIEYAHARGAVVVAAVGNADQAPRAPWPYANWPAALPHVIGVSALTPAGDVPAFSNRDAVFNDIAAPGQQIVSTLPRLLTQLRPACAEQGYSLCGPQSPRASEGTSYAAALVSGAAALLIAVRPDLVPEQVAFLLERYASDVNAATGCRACAPQRDALSGWGRLDVLASVRALEGPLPLMDQYEPNDDADDRAFTVWGRKNVLRATLDFWDDNVDVYRVLLRKGQGISLTLRGLARTDTNLVLWRPGTTRVEGLSPSVQRMRVAQSARAGANEGLFYRARQTGWHYVEVKLATPGSGRYTLRYVKSR